MPQIAVHVVFDTNSIYAKASADKLLSYPASKLIKSFSPNASVAVHWYLAPMVKSEREYQMVDEALELLPAVRKASRFMEQTFNFTEEDARAQVHRIINRQVEDHGIREIAFNEGLVDWSGLINRAVRRLPPFEKGQEEKGFRDAIILETFLQLHKKLALSAPNKLVLLSSDNLLKAAAEQALLKSPEVLLIDSVAKLETYLVALSEQIDQSTAQEIILAARRFLLEGTTLARLNQLLSERFKIELQTGPPQGGLVNAWWVLPGETALVARQNSRWEFETTVLIEAQASRTIRAVPSYFEQFTSEPDTKGLATAGIVNLYASGVAIGKGSASISTLPTANYASNMNVGFPVSDRVVKSIGRHTTILVWSAKLSDDQKLTDFEVQDIKYQGVIWEQR